MSLIAARFVAAIAAFTACGASLHAQAKQAPGDDDALAAEVIGSSPGLAVVGRWQGGMTTFGVAPRDGTTKALASGAPQPIFEIGSISKLFTGLLLAQDVERGDLRLDQTLADLKPEGTSLDPQVGAVTLRELITHRGCLPSVPDDVAAVADAPDPYAHFTREQLWRALARFRMPHAAPCEYAYSNWGVATVAEVIAARAGRSYAQLVEERITRPLHMADTSVAIGDAAPARLVPGFDGQRPAAHWTFQAGAGAGGIRSTAADLLLFGRAILAGHAGPLGAAAERVVTPLAEDTGGAIGYAVEIQGDTGDRLYSHGGLTSGFHSMLAILPKSGEVFVILASNSQAAVEYVAHEIEANHFALALPQGSVDMKELGLYQGVFRIDPRRALTFVVQDQRLYGRMTGQPFIPLAPAGRDAFAVPAIGAAFAFHRSGDQVNEVELRQAGVRLNGHRTPDPVPRRALMDAHETEAYGGEYLFEGGGHRLHFVVHAAGGQVDVKLDNEPAFGVYEVPGRRDRFRYDAVDAELQFERDASDRVVDLVLFQNGAEIRARRMAATASAH